MGNDFSSQGSETFECEGAHDGVQNDFDSCELSDVAVELSSDRFFD